MTTQAHTPAPSTMVSNLLASSSIRPLRFLFVGALTFPVNIGLLRLLEWVGLSSVPAYALALTISVQFNFLVSSAFVWADRRIENGWLKGWAQRWLSFHGCVGAAVALNMGVFVLISSSLPDIAAVVVATSCATAVKFVWLDRLAFRAASLTPAPAETA